MIWVMTTLAAANNPAVQSTAPRSTLARSENPGFIARPREKLGLAL
jgi:hypothetical protein